MSTDEVNSEIFGIKRRKKKLTVQGDNRGKNEYSFDDQKIKEFTIKGAQGRSYDSVRLYSENKQCNLNITNQQDIIYHFLYNLSLNHTCFIDHVKPKKSVVGLVKHHQTPNDLLSNSKKSLKKDSLLNKNTNMNINMNIAKNPTLDYKKEDPPEEDYNQILYKGESPDEVILVDAARRMGFIYHSGDETNANLILLRENGGKNISQKVEVKFTFEYTSARGMMSTLVKINNNYILYSKGSDKQIKLLLEHNDKQPFKNEVLEYANKLSEKGLRILLIGMKLIHEEEWENWFANYDSQLKKISDEAEVNNFKKQQYNILEKGITLIGCTAVEDKLQDNVPNTIKELQTARINFWVLTGDNLPTAKNIGIIECNKIFFYRNNVQISST